MESIAGTITRFVFRSPSTGWKIGKFKPADGSAEFSIKGEITESNLDCDLTIKGEWIESKFGREFQVNNCLRSAPSSLENIQKWISNNVKGVGPAAALKMGETFGQDLKRVIETTPEKLADIKGISKKTALLVQQVWVTDVLNREVGLLLSQGELSDKLAAKVIKQFGSNSVQVIQDNPYRLTSVSGIGFKTADKMALGSGWSVQRPERIDAAISYILLEALNDGHTFLHKSELIEKVCRLAEVEASDGKSELLPEDQAVAAIDREIASEAIKFQTIRTNGVQHSLCYLPHAYFLEIEIAERIAELQSTPHIPIKNIGAILKKVEAELLLTLSDQQKDGVVSVLSNNCSIITGLPGTGKTSTVRALVTTARALGLSVALAAPTGRAAKRLSEVTNTQATTIHRLLKYDPLTNDFVYNRKNKLRCNMLILDEASMIDIDLMASLLRAVPDDCSIAFIGDINQLPSVGAGTILRDLINSKRIHVTVLDKIFRQAEGSLIIQNAHRIHRGEMPAFPAKGETGDSFWIKVPRAMAESGQVTDDIDFVKSTLADIYKRLEKKYKINAIKDVQLLTPMRVGPAGYNALNLIIQNMVNPDGERIEIKGQVFRVGDRIMQTKNDYELEVFNGDVGFVRSVDIEEKKLVIEWSDRTQDYPFDALDNLSLAYAVSVHKAQGSEFQYVIMLFLNHHYTMLDRNLIYTAGTRARKMAIYLASHSAIERAVRTQHVLKRNSLLAQRIKMAVDREMKSLAAA